jgi:hypothetical protein
MPLNYCLRTSENIAEYKMGPKGIPFGFFRQVFNRSLDGFESNATSD